MDIDSIVRIETERGFGSGALISPFHVITCAHVVSAFDPRRPNPADLRRFRAEISVWFPKTRPAERQSAQVLDCALPDLAVLKLDKPSAGIPIKFRRAAQTLLESPELPYRFVAGYETNTQLSPTAVRVSHMEAPSILTGEDSLLHFQTKGGLGHGMSGGPLLIPVNDVFVGAGLACLGGIVAGQSLSIASAEILRFLAPFEIDAESLGPLYPPAPVLRVSALGSLSRKQRIPKGISAATIAAAADTTASTLESWENGLHPVPGSLHNILWKELIDGDAEAVENWLRLTGTPDALTNLRDRQNAATSGRMIPAHDYSHVSNRSLGRPVPSRPRYAVGSDIRIQTYLPYACQTLFLNAEVTQSFPRIYSLVGSKFVPGRCSGGTTHFRP